jgi:predicted NAD/FAD-binding protein
MKRERIAIIGGGAAGTTAAWQLHTLHDITLFEAAPRLGGHAYTHHFKVGEESLHVDMGVEYFNERLAPNLFAMLQELAIETYIAPMSFRAAFAGDDNAWSNLHGQGRLRRELTDEIDRFHQDMTEVLGSGDPRYKKLNIGEFLAERGYSEAFKQQALLPLLTTFSGCNAPSLEYTLMYVAISFNMSLLSFFSPGCWRKAKGGIDGYLIRLGHILGERVRLDCPIRQVRKQPGKGWLVETVQGVIEPFDSVVFATHADVTLKLLESPTAEQHDILSRFDYVPTHSVLHSDASLLVDGGRGEYCEFSRPAHLHDGDYGQLTRINNALAPYAHLSEPVLVTFDPKQPVAAGHQVHEQRWKLPKLRPLDFYQKTRYRRIQGLENLWYCGTDTSLTGHEGAVVSGMVIAHRLGADHPYADNGLAAIQFNVIKDLMGVHRPSERFKAALGSLVFAVAKGTSLHKSQSHKFIKDVIV